MFEIFKKKNKSEQHKRIINTENLIIGSTNPILNGLDLYYLLALIGNKKITIIGLNEDRQVLYEGNANYYNCERIKYEVINFEKLTCDNSYMIKVNNLIDPITVGTLSIRKNEKYTFPKIHDPFIYSAGLSYLWKFIERYPDKSNFLNKDIINEVISTDYDLSCFKEPFLYINDGISRIVFEFEIYKNISENNSYELDVDNINVKEIINFAEKLIRSNGF